ncbi:MAG: thioesterase [Sphingobacteriales bacterium]|nr:MAG: thioesterase [Sphingobacteriales bacterium]
MPRVKIKFPDEKPLFQTSIPIRIGDINYGAHLGNDSVLSIIHEARMQMLAQWGYTELEAGSVSLIMADVMIAYKAEAFYGDVLQVAIYADEFAERSFDLLYHFTVARDGDRKDIAHAKTGMACFDYKLRKTVAISEELKNKLSGLGN